MLLTHSFFFVLGEKSTHTPTGRNESRRIRIVASSEIVPDDVQHDLKTQFHETSIQSHNEMNLLDFDNRRRLTPTPLRVIIGLAYVDLVRRGGYHIKTALERLRRRGLFGKAIDVFDAYVFFVSERNTLTFLR